MRGNAVRNPEGAEVDCGRLSQLFHLARLPFALNAPRMLPPNDERLPSIESDERTDRRMNKKLLSIFVALVLALTAMLPMSAAGAVDPVEKTEFYTIINAIQAVLTDLNTSRT